MMKSELQAFWNGIKRSLGAAADLMVLNLLMIACCVPVVTAGASWTAGYAQILRIVRGGAFGFPIRPFFEDFRKTFRQATVAWLLLLLCAGILGGDFYYAVYVASPVNVFFLAFSVLLAIPVVLTALWLFPLIARYENALGAHIKNALLLAVATLPRTVLALIAFLVFLGLPLLLPDVFLYLGWIWVLFGLSFPMHINAKLFRDRLASAPEKEEDGED